MDTKTTQLKNLTKTINEHSFKTRHREFTISSIFSERYFSDILAWLLDPNGTHGLNSTFLKDFLTLLAKKRSSPKNNYKRLKTTLKWGKAGKGITVRNFSLANTAVVKEFHFSKSNNRSKNNVTNYIDIALLDFDRTGSFFITIENKLFGNNSKRQLINYEEQVNSKFKELDCREFVYLTYSGKPPKKYKPNSNSEIKNWVRISWIHDLLPMMQKSLETNENPKLKEFVEVLNWSRQISSLLDKDFITNFRFLYLNVISTLVLDELNRFLKPDLKPWVVRSINEYDIAIRHPSFSTRNLYVDLLGNFNITLQSHSSSNSLYEKMVIPFGIHVEQLLNLIELSVKKIYRYHLGENYKAYYIKRHRKIDITSGVTSTQKNLLKAVHKNRTELKMILSLTDVGWASEEY